MLEYYRRLVEYNRWANAETLQSLRGADPPLRAVRWMAHIVDAEALWLARLRHEATSLAVWPELDVEGCAAHLTTLADHWEEVMADLSPEALSDGIAYRNTKGEFWTNSVADVLTHMMFHSGYHRGQIAAEVRAAGGTPARTDCIHAVRQSHIQ